MKKRKVSCPAVDSSEVKGEFASFSQKRGCFLKNHGNALASAEPALAQEFASLAATAIPLQVGRLFRRLDEAMSNQALREVVEEWQALTRPRRRAL